MAAERETVDRLIAAHLAERINGEFDGRISGVTKAGLFVQLPQFGTDGFVPVSTLDGDYYVFDETARALVGERTGKGFQLADAVSVKLVDVAPLAGALRFEMLSEPKPMPGVKRSFHKAKSRRVARPRLEAATRPAWQEMTMDRDRHFRRREPFRHAPRGRYGRRSSVAFMAAARTAAKAACSSPS